MPKLRREDNVIQDIGALGVKNEYRRLTEAS
jgi:hypothetical protein